MNKTIYIIIGCDTDPDRDYFVRDVPSPTDSLGWRGMLEGIPRAKDKLRGLRDSDGNSPIFTWFLRADNQIKHIYGAYDYVLTTHKKMFLELVKDGDELGWHPHFWFYDEKKKVWYQNYKDIDRQIEMLTSAFAVFETALPGWPQSVRMGWTYQNNRTIETLSNLGISIDASAIPGMRIIPKEGHSSLSNFYDWSISQRSPYYPSSVDYRRKAIKGEKNLSILQVPNYISNSRFWGLLSGMVLAKKMKDIRQIGYAIARPSFMATITSKASLFRPMLSQIKRDILRDNNVFYLTPLHPDELIDNIHPVYSLENMFANIESILELGHNLNVKVKYVRVMDLKSIFESENREK